MVIASKFGTRVKNFSGTDVEVSLLQSLEKLKTDYIDLYQVHVLCCLFHDGDERLKNVFKPCRNCLHLDSLAEYVGAE